MLSLALACLALSLPVQDAATAECGALDAKDRAAIRALIDRYRSSWMAGDARGVLSTFTDDAVLLPHHGDAPVVGGKAIEKFWWPPGAPPFKLLDFELTVDEIGGCGALAHARGAHQMSWSIEEGSKVKRFRQRGTYLVILRRLADGSWRTSHRMWDDPAAVEITGP